ncbi:MAG: electron transfer flavoprotein subunit beta/FixA family protein [Chloroflexi bacterium]|nr:electron transfer flavoprotein subunit beta/FixA family protein [Chloroflexota bacterium]
MNIIVCVKQVPDTAAVKKIDEGTMRLTRTAVENVLNPYDEYAVEEGLQLAEKNPESTVTLVSVGPPNAQEAMRKALAMGADRGVILSDEAMAGSDTLATAKGLAALIKTQPFDLVLTAHLSTDATTGQVPGMVAGLLGIPQLTYAKKVLLENGVVTIHRATDEGYEVVSAKLPALVSVIKGANEPRYPSLKGIMSARRKEVVEYKVSQLGLSPEEVGPNSQAKVLRLSYPEIRRACEVIKADGKGGVLLAEYLEKIKVI